MSETEWCLSHRHGQKSTTADQRVAVLAARRRGIVTRRQLVACGMTDRMIAVRVRRGWLHPVHRGVYAVGHAALTETASFVAAVLACGASATLGFHAAAAHLQMLDHDGRDPDVIVPRNGGRKIDGIRVHRTRLDRRDVWIRDGIRVTSPARTILDLAATMHHKPLRRLARQAQAEERVNVGQLLDVVERHPRHRGAAKLRAVIADGPAPTRSDHEDLVLDLLDRAGIERPELNPRLRLDDRRMSPDMLWPEHKLAIECDSRRWHSDPLTVQNDADKQAILEAHGFRVLRITWQQAVGRPRQTLARVKTALSGARSGS
jgi:predicted transcriptional regulator of viral defense system